MSKITELQEKRARIWKQAKDFLNAKTMPVMKRWSKKLST